MVSFVDHRLSGLNIDMKHIFGEISSLLADLHLTSMVLFWWRGGGNA
jgi:hypothetical protein